jgi:hypothetical protein
MSELRDLPPSAAFVGGTDSSVGFPLLDAFTEYTITVTVSDGLTGTGSLTFNSSEAPYINGTYEVPFLILSTGDNFGEDMSPPYEGWVPPDPDQPTVNALSEGGPAGSRSLYEVTEGGELDVNAADGVLVNDFLANNSPAGGITAELAQGPDHGSVTLSTLGSFIFHAAADFYGRTFFRYYAIVGGVKSLMATVYLQVNVPSIANGIIKDHRTAGAGPVEGGPFKVVAGEHFDVGSTFRFNLAIVPPTIPGLRYRLVADEIVHPADGFPYTRDKIVASGTGGAFDYTFSAVNLAKWDSGHVEFYIDRNGDGQFNPGEPRNTSPTFFVLQPKVYAFGVWYSSKVATDPSGRISDELSTGTRLLISRDSDDDWRAVVRLRLKPGQPYMFAAGPDMPDPPLNMDEVKKLYATPPNWTIIVVSDFFREGATENFRIGQLLGTNDEIVYSMANTIPAVLAHEVGHIAGNTWPGDGFGHNTDQSGNYIMTSGDIKVGTRDLLTDDEARKYDGGP